LNLLILFLSVLLIALVSLSFRKPRHKNRPTISVTIGGITIKGATMVLFHGKQYVTASINPTGKSGSKSDVEDVIWSSSDEAIFFLRPDRLDPESPYSREIVSTGNAGTAQVVVKADALIGEGIAELMAFVDLEAKAEMATSLGIAVGAPIDEA
jgi:hypothetical protein